MNNIKDKKQYVFSCIKCEHELFADNTEDVLGYECPNCGASRWEIIRLGNFKKEKNNYKKIL